MKQNITENNNAGFTLIEVLVALAIAAISLTAILQLALNSTKLTYAATTQFNCLPVAVEEMEELKNRAFFTETSKTVKDYTVKARLASEDFMDLRYNKLTLEVLYNDVSQIQLYWFDIKNIEPEKQ